MSNIAIIGDKDTIWPFKAFGFATYSIKDIKNANEILKNTLDKEYSIIFVTEDVFRQCEQQIQEIQSLPVSAIVILPNNQGSQGIGQGRLQQILRKAVGSEIG
ncbi:V-type ATP synthase subunit F [Candidatus Desantisbacteria bacterium]|nr:V-type ATP synthase subunit F [Candidatus Desantisbacteria bacterium]